MRSLEHLKPSFTPPAIARHGEVMVWRERILHTLLLITSVGALITFFLALPRALAFQDWTTLIIYSVALAVALALPIFRRLSFGLRSRILIILFFFLAVQNFIVYGVTRNGAAYLLAVIILTGLFLGLRAGITAILIASGTIAFFGFGMNNGWLAQPLQETLLTSISLQNWISVGVHIGFLGGFTIVAVHMITTGLQSSLQQQRTLTNQLNISRLNLEKNVEQRTASLQRRLTQIRTAADISRAVSSMLDPHDLLQQVVDLIQSEFDLYYVGAFLIDESAEFAVLKAGSGEAGRQMIAANHRLAVSSNSMIGWATARLEPRIALDTGQEAVRFNNPHLPLTRSELALPIISRDSCLGALSIQSSEPEAFDQDDIRILQGITDSIAIALENARLFQETQDNLNEIRSLNRAYLQQGWNEAFSAGQPLVYQFRSQQTSQSDAPSKLVHIPLSLRDQTIGNLTLEMNAETLGQEDLEFIDGVATQTAIALENARLIQETQRKALQEQKISQMTAHFSNATTVDQILKSALAELSRLPQLAEISVQLIPPDDPGEVKK